MPSPSWWGAYSLYAALLVAVARQINNEVTEPYMDEIFHVPQAQAYCRGEWRYWDGALTTPPGLYLLPAVLSHLQRSLSSYTPPAVLTAVSKLTFDPCSLSALRPLNLSLVLLLPFLYSSLLLLLHTSSPASPTVSKDQQRRKAGGRRGEEWEALVIALHPLVGWWAWLYYTDVASLFTVLLCWREGLKGRQYRAAAYGAASLWFRQTNIIWLGFVAAQLIISQLASTPSSTPFRDPLLSDARWSDVLFLPLSLLRSFLLSPLTVWSALSPFLNVFVAALLFVRWNGGIVLGDKQNHVATLHVPQVYYFIAFAGAFCAPRVLSLRKVRRAVGGLVGSWRRAVLSLVTVAGMCCTIKEFTIAHPFLLSDNRHYSFYLWRRLINVHPYARYFLAPGYLFATRLIFDELARVGTMRLSTFLLFTASTIAVLVPTPLLEPRYFLIPLLILRLYLSPPPSLSSPSSSKRRFQPLAEAALYVTIQAACVYLFLRRTFVWDVKVGGDGKGLEGRDEREVGRVQRFMW